MSQVIIDLLKYPAAFIAAGALCYVALLLSGRAAAFFGLVDIPRDRHVHRSTVPLVGGIAIFTAFFCACLLIFLGPWSGLTGRLDAGWCRKFFVIAGLFLVLGIVDDRADMKPYWKLAGQAAAAVVAFLLDVRFGRVLGVSVPLGLDLAATVVWFVAFVNAFNLIDGMDGVATGVAITGMIGLLILFALGRQPGSVMVLLAMLGACAVFLYHNFYPAKFFLGDAGSMLLGAFFSTVALSSNTKGVTVASLGFPLLVAGVPLMDSVLAVWRRMLRKWLVILGMKTEQPEGSEVMYGDLEHLHHRLAARGLSHHKVAYILYGVNAFLVAAGLLVVIQSSLAVGVGFISFVVLVYVMVRHLATIELGISGQALISGLHRPDARTLANVAHPLFDCLALLAGSFAAIALAHPVLDQDMHFRLLWLRCAPALVSIPMLALFAAGTYRRLWSRARISEYCLLLAALGASVTAAIGVLNILESWSFYQSILLLVLVFSFDGVLIMGARAFPRILIDLSAWNWRKHQESNLPRALIYGAGFKSTLLLRDLTFRSPDAPPPTLNVLGLIDDDPNTWNRLVHGYRVLGGCDVLCSQIEGGAVDAVLLACDIPEHLLQRVVAAARRGNVRVDRWACATRPVVHPGGG